MNRQDQKRIYMAHLYAISDRLLITGIEVKQWGDKLKNHECTEWEAYEGVCQCVYSLFPEVGLIDLAGKLYAFLIADLQSR